MKNMLIIFVFIVSSLGICQHFQPVYTGNPYLPMNIYVTSASHPTDTSKYLKAGDEIGIFDGNVCVGAKVLTGPIVQGSPLALIASADDPTTPNIDGFITGNTIKYRIWMAQLNTEIPSDSIIPTYSFGNSTFSTLGTSVVVLNSNLIPVELISFTSLIHNRGVQLSWSTATEANNRGFEVERNMNNNWQKIGFVPGAGTTTEKSDYSFIDDFSLNPNSGIVHYRLKQIDFDGSFEYSDEISVDVDFKPSTYALMQNYPNPFNPSTTIQFYLPETADVTLNIYTQLGVKVEELLNQKLSVGVHSITYDAKDLSTGVYFYELVANGNRFVKKLTLIK